MLLLALIVQVLFGSVVGFFFFCKICDGRYLNVNGPLFILSI